MRGRLIHKGRGAELLTGGKLLLLLLLAAADAASDLSTQVGKCLFSFKVKIYISVYIFYYLSIALLIQFSNF